MLDGFDEQPNVRFPPHIAELDCISKCQVGEIGWQVLGRRHRRTLDQNRDDPDALVLERTRHLHPQKIVGIVDAPPLEAGILDGQPLPPDDGKEHRARFKFVLDELEEIRPWGNVVGVFEDPIGAEMAAQGGQQSEHMARAVFAAVADKNPR